jgi:hypothetical protein
MFDTVLTDSTYYTKIKTLERLNVYHNYNALLPLKLEGCIVVHDGLVGIF